MSRVADTSGCQEAGTFDIIFVLDSSGSIGSANFIAMKDFVKDVIGVFVVGPTQTQFGVIIYRYRSNAL